MTILVDTVEKRSYTYNFLLKVFIEQWCQYFLNCCLQNFISYVEYENMIYMLVIYSDAMLFYFFRRDGHN